MLRPKREGVKAAGAAPALARPRRVRHGAAHHRVDAVIGKPFDMAKLAAAVSAALAGRA